MAMTLTEMADDLQAIIDGERPRLNKTEMREYVRTLRAITQPAQAVDVGAIEQVANELWALPFVIPNARGMANKLTAAIPTSTPDKDQR